jgi:predicted nucleic acid-binding protein
MPDEFVDSNVVIYALGIGRKAERARELLLAGPCISVQVLNEVLNVGRKKARWSWEETKRNLVWVQTGMHAIIPVTLDIHARGLHLAERYGLSTYDAMIAAAALEVRCRTLWSEDMQDGLVLNGSLTVRSPFLAK